MEQKQERRIAYTYGLPWTRITKRFPNRREESRRRRISTVHVLIQHLLVWQVAMALESVSVSDSGSTVLCMCRWYRWCYIERFSYLDPTDSTRVIVQTIDVVETWIWQGRPRWSLKLSSWRIVYLAGNDNLTSFEKWTPLVASDPVGDIVCRILRAPLTMTACLNWAFMARHVMA